MKKDEFLKSQLRTRRIMNQLEIYKNLSFEDIPEIFICVRVKTGEIMAASDEWKEKLGIDNEEMVGINFIDFVSECDKKKTWDLFSGIIVNEPIHKDYHFENHYDDSKGIPVKLTWKSRVSKNEKYIIATARIVTQK